jgi:phosphatidate cytidylyltransferase
LVGSPPEKAGDSGGTPRSKVLAVRIAAGAALIPVVLALSYWGGLAFAAFVALLAGLGSHEFYRICSGRDVRYPGTAALVGSVAVTFSFYRGSFGISGLILTAAAMAVLVERLLKQDTETYALATAVGVFGLVYVGWLMGFFILLRNAAGLAAGSSVGRGPGFLYVLFVLVVTWSYDSLAYLAGSFLGKHRLFRRISPSKTVEGTVVGLAASTAAAIVCKAAFADFLGWFEAALVGVMIGVAAQVGDLVESIIKRSTDTKDSSRLIPGHGGMLDRFDSLLFTGPVFYIYMKVTTAWMAQ